MTTPLASYPKAMTIHKISLDTNGKLRFIGDI
jgi:hypothetical protein